MGDVRIVIKDGHIVGVDDEDGEYNEVDNFSGSGEGDIISTTTTETPRFTPTSNGAVQKASSPGGTNFLPYIIAAVAVAILLILLVTIFLCYRRRRRRRAKSTKSNVAVIYTPNQQGGAGDGYSTAIPLTLSSCEPPLEEAPPPPLPSSNPPLPPHLSASGSSTSTRYTPLGGRKPAASSQPEEDEKNSIYEQIDDNDVANVYESAKPDLPKTNSGRKRQLFSVGEDPNMGNEKDKMLPSKE